MSANKRTNESRSGLINNVSPPSAGFVTAIMDQFSGYFAGKYSREALSGIVVIICFICGIPMVTQVRKIDI